MAIDIGRGIQRIYIVLSLLWIAGFLFLIYDMFPSKEKDRYIISGNSCDVITLNWTLGTDTKIYPLIIGIPDTSRNYTYKGETKNHILYSEVLKQPKKYKLYKTLGDDCGLFEFKTFYQRLVKNWNILLIASLPIPLYFILLFIVRGFRKKDK